MIGAATLRGYAGTTYAVSLPDQTTIGLRIGGPCPQADEVLRRMKAVSLCCVNAWNPMSRPLPVTRNMAGHQRLRRDLDARRLRHLPQLGVPDRPGWRPEPGFAVLDLGKEKAIRLAETYGQFAVVYYRCDGSAELLLTRHALR